MKKLLTEWRQFLKEAELSGVEASVERDADLGKHADIKMEIENALRDANPPQDWVIDMDDWPAAPGRSPEEFQEAMTQMEAALQNYLGVSIKGLLAGELLPKKNESVEKEISKTLSDEGGASGLDPLHKAAKKVEKKISKKEVEDIIKKMDNVTKHRDGDYIKEGSVIDDLSAATNLTRPKITLDPEEEEDIDLDDDDEDVAESRSSYNRDTIRKMVEEEIAKSLDEGGKCTKATKKASSTSKGKKWMKCVKNPDGKGYIRKHWGQKGVRVTGKSGNTKRKKSFRARHGCADAKPGTSKKLACDDW
jgi:hypothetical protein